MDDSRVAFRRPGSEGGTPGDLPAARTTLREIRFAGRGGHGVVTAGELLGRAALLEGRFAQAIPTFGPERRGALAQCTVRISGEPVLLKCNSLHPDVLVVFDPTIWQMAPVTIGLGQGGVLIFNTKAAAESVEADLRSGAYASRLAFDDARVLTLDATGIALEVLGRPIMNTAMLGALAAATADVSLTSVEAVLEEHFGPLAGANVEAARAGHAAVAKGGRDG
jgi:2-oxoacid:acceptor oxidoreductase gamma subunit (pyruvate/2-ketoisovalerate family)